MAGYAIDVYSDIVNPCSESVSELVGAIASKGGMIAYLLH